eukprot:scpid97443/ scgid22679/ 
MAPISSTNETSVDVLLNGGHQIVFVSIVLRSVLYIRGDGEIRLDPVPSTERVAKETIRKLCEDHGDFQMCLFGSADGRYLLSVNEETGILHTVGQGTSLPSSQEENVTDCVWFEERDIPNANTTAFTQLTGCPVTQRYPVSFSGTPLKKDSRCSAAEHIRFVQTSVVRSRTNHVWTKSQRPLQRFFKNRESAVSHLSSQCPGVLRESYPLHWDGCA